MSAYLLWYGCPLQGSEAWIIVSLVMVLVLAVSGPRVSGVRFREIGQRAAAEEGALSPELRSLTHAPILEWSHYLRMGSFLGIVLLMVVKPGLVGSLLVIAVALPVAGALSLLRASGTEELQPATTH